MDFLTIFLDFFTIFLDFVTKILDLSKKLGFLANFFWGGDFLLKVFGFPGDSFLDFSVIFVVILRDLFLDFHYLMHRCVGHTA